MTKGFRIKSGMTGQSLDNRAQEIASLTFVMMRVKKRNPERDSQGYGGKTNKIKKLNKKRRY